MIRDEYCQTLNHKIGSRPYGCQVKGHVQNVHEIQLPFEIKC